MVNVKTISGVKGVNALVGYKEMLIYTPIQNAVPKAPASSLRKFSAPRFL